MILANYWKWLNGATTLNTDSSSYYDPSQDVGLIGLGGEPALVSFASSIADRRYKNRNIAQGMVRLGGGNGDIAYNDYAMSDDLINETYIDNWNITSGVSDAGLERTITVTGRNTSDSAITITEIGYAKYVETEQDGSQYVLIAKTKLNAPINVEPNDTFFVNMSWLEQ